MNRTKIDRSGCKGRTEFRDGWGNGQKAGRKEELKLGGDDGKNQTVDSLTKHPLLLRKQRLVVPRTISIN